MEERFNAFTVLINNLSRSIRKLKAQEMSEFDLKSSHVSCLYYLNKFGTLTAKELCDISSEDKANISRSIEHLEDGGYIVCKSDAPKRYKSPLELTEKGRAIAEKITHKVDVVIGAANEGLDEETRIAMYRGLSVIYNNLQKMCDDYEK